MAQKFSISHLRSKLRQAENKRKQQFKQQINKINQKVRQHNQKARSAVNAYNSEVRKHNARLRANRQRIITAVNRLNSRATIRYQVLTSSTLTLNTAYQKLDSHENDFEGVSYGNEFLDLSERENANSLDVSNILESYDETVEESDEEDLGETSITDELLRISQDLDNRWKGALYSINPKNPDASRHFCTSAREIFVGIFSSYAPDDEVQSRFPNCEKTDKGAPTRRWQIKYMLENTGLDNEIAINFVDEDIQNIMQLFRVFNDGTHGSSGRFEINKLVAIKKRVENGISFLSRVQGYS